MKHLGIIFPGYGSGVIRYPVGVAAGVGVLYINRASQGRYGLDISSFHFIEAFFQLLGSLLFPGIDTA